MARHLFLQKYRRAILSRVAVIGLAAATIATPLGISAAHAVGGSFDVGADVSYTEGATPISALSDFTVTNTNQDYAGGSVTYTIEGANESGEILSLTTSQSASTTNGAISVVGTTVFKGNGTTADAIGNIDGTLTGSASDLKVNFANSFQNGDFSQGFTGWTVNNNRVNLGYINASGSVVQSDVTIGGFTPPVDFTFGPGTTGVFDRASAPNTYTSSTSGQNLFMQVNSGSCGAGYCVLRGPSVISNAAVYLGTGDSVSFTWQANAGDDAFDVYGYLLNTQNGKAIKLIDETGTQSRTAGGSVTATMGSARSLTNYFTSGTRRSDLKTRSVGSTSFTTGTSSYNDLYFTDGTPFTPGQYKFVFIAGSYDDSGGQALGATFTIDNVAVSSSSQASSVTSADVQALSRLLTYSNTSGLNATRTLSFNSSVSDTAVTGGADKVISVTAVNDPPVIGAVTGPSYTDTSAVDTFSNSTGTATATDEEGNTITFSIAGGTTSGNNSIKVGTYGTLTLNSSTGAYTFTPNAGAINALDTNQTETFVIQASDGNSTASQNFVVTINATIDALPGAPTITNIVGSDRSLTVTFTPPSSNGTSAIVNYQYSTDGVNWISFNPAVTSSPAVIQYRSSDGTTRLTNGTSYPISLRAVNSTGPSVSSNSQTAQPGATVSFFQNGGAGTMNVQAGSATASLSRNLFTRSNYDFAGWNTLQDANGTWFADEESYSFSSSMSLYAQWITTSSVSWTPDTSRVLATVGTITPSAGATSSGNGAISYAVLPASTSDCAVNASTGVITFTTAGSCIVRASSALTRAFYSSSRDVTFTITPTVTAVDLALDVSAGQEVAGAPSNFEATGLSPGTQWELVLRSTPQILASGITDPSGSTFGTVTIPSGLEPGWHSLTLSGTSLAGLPVTEVLWFEITATGTLVTTSFTEPAAAPLAHTGMSLKEPLALAGVSLVAGLLLLAMYHRRRRLS